MMIDVCQLATKLQLFSLVSVPTPQRVEERLMLLVEVVPPSPQVEAYHCLLHCHPTTVRRCTILYSFLTFLALIIFRLPQLHRFWANKAKLAQHILGLR
jgi:hypothetical protein